MKKILDHIKRPKVSIIVPNYNHAPYLSQRIDSILNQTYQDFELIILDDYSTDDSREIIENYRHNVQIAQVIYNQNNSGSPFKQWQKGLELASGEYIWIAESDDWCDPNFLSTALIGMDAKYDLFYSKSIFIDEHNKKVNLFDDWLNKSKFTKWNESFICDTRHIASQYLIYHNIILNTSSVVFKKSLLTTDMLTNLASFRYCGDWYLWISIFYNKWRVCYSIETNNYFRITKSSTVSSNKDNFQWNLEMIKIIKVIFLNNEKSSKSFHNKIYNFYKENYFMDVPRKKIMLYLQQSIRILSLKMNISKWIL
ncbi:glycosyltransferase involved in cell wall biosynthesis [Pedobacter psychrotolerans]|uniref:Glycosyltransferase involved in cell wall biosynthesis n=1 Tax=Pedobacter psychrotolerans TaxID=1843235 RepID=A0A4R2HL40_9SPHI|nr:glycosyltransferase family 2 protein [Pedobacter psychrotolerans]TCO30799.1 glycosyltransferase involved in cell wall biosynthesis [Pedobacter psychrotolerans]GGE44353.1 hypothetical protein GCM10011413_08080 [Pedobacter psychrotolerans]